MEVTGTTAAIEIAPLAVDVARAAVTGVPSAELQAAIDQIAAADAVIASTPVYKAGISGLFKSFVDVLDNDLLIAKPVVLAATAGSSRHALVVDEQMRSLFAYMRALTLPTSVFAAPEDWGAAELGERIRRAATELAVDTRGQIEKGIADRAWSGYQHEFAGNATRARADGRGHRLRLAADATRRRRPRGLNLAILRTGSAPSPMPRASVRADPSSMSPETSTDPPFRRHADLRCRSCGYSISAYADVPARCPMCSAKRPWAALNRGYAARSAFTPVD